MTEETTPLLEKTNAQSESQSNVAENTKSKEVKKEKCRPMTKVVVRRLPPSMTREEFLEQTSPLPEHDYFYFVKADASLGQFAFSRAYINFVDQQDVFIFREKFDNYVFVDAKGAEYAVVVEFAPFQKLPKKRDGKKKDPKCGTIETDNYFMNFLESLKNQEPETGAIPVKTEFSYQPTESSQKKVATTPLLDFIKQRKLDKQRIRDEKREERKKRDLDRKKVKEFEVLVSKATHADVEKETTKDKENKEEKEKVFPKEPKNLLKKEDKFRDRQKERETKTAGKSYKEKQKETKKKYEEKKAYGRREDRGVQRNEPKEKIGERKVEEKKGKSYEKMRQEKRRLAEFKKQNAETNSNAEKDELEVAKEKSEKAQVRMDKESCQDVEEKSDQVEKKDNILENHNEENESLPSDLKGKDSSSKEKSRSNEKIDREDDDSKMAKSVKRRNSLESGGEGGSSDSGFLRRHKSLDGGDESNLQKNDYKGKHKKDPRLERRIRNKDRPAMEIYRPGMGRFSKQRLEREKTSDDRSSQPESSTSVNTSKNSKSGSEVRSMTFKRSSAREN